MEVQYIWRNCDYSNGEWGQRPVTSYWVKAQASDLPALSSRTDNTRVSSKSVQHLISEEGIFFFLVAQDLSSLMLLPAFYPESGMWHGHSPFEALDPIEINSLDEIQTIGSSPADQS